MAMLDTSLSEEEAIELACKAHMGVWAERRRGFVNADFHWEWNELAMTKPRLCVVAPREHAKSETFTIDQVCWRLQYTPGMQAYVFALTGDQAKKLKARIDQVMWDTAPWMIERPIAQNESHTQYSNWSMVTVAGAGKGVRGEHPDLIIGDDVLSEEVSLTHHQRTKFARWWSGTVGGMSHPGTWRSLGRGEDTGQQVWMQPTIVHLVGTPFHAADLLMGMRENPLYHFRRYAAEYEPGDLVPGTCAVEVA